MMNGGFRVSELINVELERDVDFQMNRIQVVGKGDKIRFVTMNDNMKDAIQEYLPIRETELNGKSNKYLFITQKTVNTGKAMCRSTVNDILDKYCEKVKEDTIHPHILRHHFGTESYNLGYSDLQIRREMGHTSQSSTDVYAHQGKESVLVLSNKRRNMN